MPRPKAGDGIGRPAPRALEVQLRRALAPMLAQAQATAARVTSAAEAKAMGAALRRAWSDAKIKRLVEPIIARAEQQGSRGWQVLRPRAPRKTTKDAAEYDGEALIEQWTTATADLISSLRDEVAERVRKDVVQAAKAGTPHDVLAARWQAQGLPVEFGTLEGRTKVIAQHQLSSLHAEVQRTRAASVGARKFRWHTQRDKDVRPAHRALEGTIHEYEDGAGDEGLPGQPINCRCWAETIIDDDVLAELGLDDVV